MCNMNESFKFRLAHTYIGFIGAEPVYVLCLV